MIKYIVCKNGELFMKIVVIDGQGGKIGSLLTELIKTNIQNCRIYAVGTNSTAAGAMLRAGADFAAAGENPVIVAARDADIITGPIGIIAADSFLGEVTPPMAQAVCQSGASKVLVPISKCNIIIAAPELTLADHIKIAVDKIISLSK
jgi:prephenate dehydrogenase